MPTLTIPPKLECFLTKKKRYKVTIGGRGGAKSRGFAGMNILGATYGLKVACFREFQASIADSVHSLIKSEIGRMEVPGFRVTDNNITHASGGEFVFRGLARNIGSIKSMDGFMRAWAEEAQYISDESLEILTPTIRDPESELWFSANPMSSGDPFSQRFIEPYRDALLKDKYYEDELHLIVWVNYDDNPWFADTPLADERLLDVDRLTLAQYEHKWLGSYNDDIENSIIPAGWFDAAVNAHVKLGFQPEGAKFMAYDPADTGPDDKGYVIRHGSVVLDADTWLTGDAEDGMGRALDKAITEQCDLFLWDCDGLGAGLKGQVRRVLNGKKMDWVMFKGSESVDFPDTIYAGETSDSRDNKTNKEMFRNKRAQYYISLRDRFYNTFLAVVKGRYIDPDKMISISADIKSIPRMRSEICRIPKKPNSNGYIQIMTKEEMKKPPLRIKKSPPLADCAMMSLYAGWSPLRHVDPGSLMPEWSEDM